MAILASTLALFFMVAFVTKSLDAYRLRNWRDRLKGEIGAMVGQHLALEAEAERRSSAGWVEEVLRDAGMVPDGVISVAVVTATPNPSSRPAPTLEAEPTPPPPQASGLLRSPHWRAWMRLLWGFD
jgi:hypothetical protein